MAEEHFLETLVLCALVLSLEGRPGNHLFELANSHKFAPSLATLGASRRAAKFAQASGADNARALWANLDDASMVRRHWQPAHEALDQAAFIVCVVEHLFQLFILRELV